MLHKMMDMQILLYAMAGIGLLGILGMAITCLFYRRKVKKASQISDLKEKWFNFCKGRDQWVRRMNAWVWVPSMASILLLCLTAVLAKAVLGTGILSVVYFQAGIAVPVVLLVLRRALDFMDKEEIIFSSMAEYMEESCHPAVSVPAAAAISREQEDAMVDYVAGSIKESSGEKGRFGELLSPEEEEIMREVIREFMGHGN